MPVLSLCLYFPYAIRVMTAKHTEVEALLLRCFFVAITYVPKVTSEIITPYMCVVDNCEIAVYNKLLFRLLLAARKL